jgi:hypothetical protein
VAQPAGIQAADDGGLVQQVRRRHRHWRQRHWRQRHWRNRHWHWGGGHYCRRVWHWNPYYGWHWHRRCWW